MENKKDWSAVIRVFGWLLQLATTLKKIAAELDAPFEAFLRLTTERGEATLRAIVQLILNDYNASLPKPAVQEGGHPYRGGKSSNGDALPENHYRVHVTYAPMPSLADLKKEFGEGNVADIFDGRPFTLHASCEGMDRTPGKRVFYLHDAGCELESEEQIAWGLAQRTEVAPSGYRPATHEEVYEFAKTHPELIGFIALGSFMMEGINCSVACVWRDHGRRVFGASSFFIGLRFTRRVLFVSKAS